MAKTLFEKALMKCTTVREVFEQQTALVDNLSDYEILALRAKYAGLTISEALLYQKALNTVKAIESKPQIKKVSIVFKTVARIA